VREACEASLKRLGTDYIDLFYLHRCGLRSQALMAALDSTHTRGGVLCSVTPCVARQRGVLHWYGHSCRESYGRRRGTGTCALSALLLLLLQG
jgi:hypothetical protein